MMHAPARSEAETRTSRSARLRKASSLEPRFETTADAPGFFHLAFGRKPA
jgi:hypothetical protein